MRFARENTYGNACRRSLEIVWLVFFTLEGPGFRYLSLLLRRGGSGGRRSQACACGRSSLTSPCRVFARALGLYGLGARSQLMYIGFAALLV